MIRQLIGIHESANIEQTEHDREHYPEHYRKHYSEHYRKHYSEHYAQTLDLKKRLSIH